MFLTVFKTAGGSLGAISGRFDSDTPLPFWANYVLVHQLPFRFCDEGRGTVKRYLPKSMVVKGRCYTVAPHQSPRERWLLVGSISKRFCFFEWNGCIWHLLHARVRDRSWV